MHVRYNETAKYFETKTSDGPPEVWTQLDLSGQTSVAAANWPIGSVFITNRESGGNPVNPNTLLGFGTWARVGGGRTLVDVDTGQTEFNTIEKTGGAKTVTLGINEIPSHNHGSPKTLSLTDNGHTHSGIRARSSGGTNQGVNTYDLLGNPYNTTYWDGAYRYPTESAQTGISGTVTLDSNGGGSAHSNLQPYITFYIWKRTA